MVSLSAWEPILFKLDIRGALPGGCLMLFLFLLVDMFDTVGTLIGVSTGSASWMRRAACPELIKRFGRFHRDYWRCHVRNSYSHYLC